MLSSPVLEMGAVHVVGRCVVYNSGKSKLLKPMSSFIALNVSRPATNVCGIGNGTDGCAPMKPVLKGVGGMPVERDEDERYDDARAMLVGSSDRPESHRGLVVFDRLRGHDFMDEASNSRLS